MKYTLVLNVRTASGQSSAVNIDLPLTGLDATNAFGVVLREVVETVCGVVEHVVTRDELLALTTSIFNGQKAVIRTPVTVEWNPVFAIANTVVMGLDNEPKEVPISMSPFGICDGTGVFRMENEKPKRLFLVFPDQDEAYDVDDGNGEIDVAKVRDAVSEIVDNLCSADIEDIVCNNMDVDEEVYFEIGEESFSYEKKEILDNMGDWADFLDGQRESITANALTEICREWECNGAEGSADCYVSARFEMRAEDEEDD